MSFTPVATLIWPARHLLQVLFTQKPRWLPRLPWQLTEMPLYPKLILTTYSIPVQNLALVSNVARLGQNLR